MTYTCRLRFTSIARFQLGAEDHFTVEVPGLSKVTIEQGDEAHIGRWIVAKMRGFATEEDARRAGERLGERLLVYGVASRAGIDLGFDRSTLQFSERIHDIARREGKEFRSETHGLMVYEEGAVAILAVSGKGVVVTPVYMLQDQINQLGELAPLTGRQRNCAALINDSFFVGPSQSQFLLRVSAVEALCDQSVKDARYVATIDALDECLISQQADEDVTEAIRHTLRNARRQSLRFAYMTKIRELLSDREARTFDQLYALRSKLLHEGEGRGDLREANQAALDIATTLLRAEIGVSPDVGYVAPAEPS
ncbi:MAG: hypothetical protein ACN4E6_01610 [Qipengyuania pacifica]